MCLHQLKIKVRNKNHKKKIKKISKFKLELSLNYLFYFMRTMYKYFFSNVKILIVKLVEMQERKYLIKDIKKNR